MMKEKFALGRRVTEDNILVSGDDERLLRVGDVCSQRVVMMHTCLEEAELEGKTIARGRFDHWKGGLPCRHFFLRDSELEPWRYAGLKPKDEPKGVPIWGQRRVFICSAFAGDMARNIDIAQAISRKAIFDGFLPMTPHIYFTQFLQDYSGYQRQVGIEAGHQWMEICDEIWVVVVDGYISEGMRADCEYATYLGLPMRMMEYTKEQMDEELKQQLK